MASARTLPVLLALPDDGRVRLEAAPRGGAPRMIVPGTAVFTSHLPPAVQARLPLVHFRAGQRFALNDAARVPAVINLTSDADVAGQALAALASWLDDSGVACFNHPRAVLATSRDAIARRLAGIDGLIVPATVRLRLDEPDELLEAVARARMHWPVIVRVAGSHTGRATVRIDGPRDAAQRLASIPWGGRDLYVTQYVPYRDDDGYHRKLRIAVVGGRAFLRHQITGEAWQLHAGDHDPRFDRRERALLEHGFPADLRPRLQQRIDAITAVVGLDYFGMDCSLRPDGSLLLFECNATMNILHNSRPRATQCDGAIARIRDALVPLLLDPARWHHSGRESAS